MTEASSRQTRPLNLARAERKNEINQFDDETVGLILVIIKTYFLKNMFDDETVGLQKFVLEYVG